MRIRAWETVCALIVGAAIGNAFCNCLGSTALAQTTAVSSWVGIWQGELDGLPSVILTLGDDSGTIEGTLVLNGINREGGPHIAVHEVHALLHPTENGMTLSFSVNGLRGAGKTMNFTVEQKSGHTAQIHCLNCGDNAPVVEITKED